MYTLGLLLKTLLIRMASELTLQKIITLAYYSDRLTYLLYSNRPMFMLISFN